MSARCRLILNAVVPPQGFHLFEGPPFRFRYHSQHEQSSENAHHAIDPVSKPMMEVVNQVRVLVQNRERPAHKIVGDPLRSNRQRHRLATDLVWKDLTEKYPCY